MAAVDGHDLHPDAIGRGAPRKGRGSGTLYVVGDDKGVDGPLVAVLIEDIFAAAKHIANTSRGNRLDPPLLLMLNEAANIAYLPCMSGPSRDQRLGRY